MDYVMESIKGILGENSIGWRKVKKNQDVLNELKNWLQKEKEFEVVLQKIQELERQI